MAEMPVASTIGIALGCELLSDQYPLGTYLTSILHVQTDKDTNTDTQTHTETDRQSEKVQKKARKSPHLLPQGIALSQGCKV